MDVFFDRLDEATLDRVRAVGLPNQPHFGATTPLAKDLKVKKRTFYPDRVDVTLVWTEPISRNTPISHYLITVTGAVGNNQQPLGLYTPKASPAIMSVPVTPEISGLTFQIQTVLANGWIQPLAVAPSTGLQVRPGNQDTRTSIVYPGNTLPATLPYTVRDVVIPANSMIEGSIIRIVLQGLVDNNGKPSNYYSFETRLNGATTTYAQATAHLTAPAGYNFEYRTEVVCGPGTTASYQAFLATPEFYSSFGGLALAFDRSIVNTVSVVLVSNPAPFVFTPHSSYVEIFQTARF